MMLHLVLLILAAAFAGALALLAIVIFFGGPSLRKHFEDSNQ